MKSTFVDECHFSNSNTGYIICSGRQDHVESRYVENDGKILRYSNVTIQPLIGGEMLPLASGEINL